MHTDINTNNTISSSQITSEQTSYLELSPLEERVYTMAHKHFTRIDTEAKQLEDNILLLTNKLRLVSSETEIESIQTKIDESDIKLKKIKEHPLHKQNRKQFLGERETSYVDYTKEIELIDKEDPYDHCFSLAEEGVNLSGIIEAVKQVGKMDKQNNLESQLKDYASKGDRANYVETYEELCKNHSDITLILTINAEEHKIAINSAALKSLLKDSNSPTTVTITLPEETSSEEIIQCLNIIQEYLTNAQIKTFDQHILSFIQLLMKAENNDKQIALAKAMGRSIEEQFFYALQDENTLKMERIASTFAPNTFVAKDTKTCLTFKTKGEWINKKLERVLKATHIDENKKKKLIEKILNDYKTIRQDDKTFNEAFPTFQATGFAATPFLYRALNQYDSNSKIRLDLIDKQDKIKEGQYTFTCHLEAITQHLPFAKNLVNFIEKSNTSNNKTLSVTLPVEYEEGLEKVYTFLTLLDPTQLRSTKQTKAIAIFQLCEYWGIEKQEVDIFHHFTDDDFAEESLFTIACSTNNQYLLQKGIRSLLQQAAQSYEDYKNAKRLFIENAPSIEKLDLAHLDLFDDLVKLLKPCTNIKELNLCGNRQLTDESLSYILELKNLTTLNLRKCPKLTKDGLESLEKLKLTSLLLLITDEEKKVYNEIAFGNDKWIKAYGIEIKEEDMGEDLAALPDDILEILESTCPTNSDKKVKDTHMLVWMPQTFIIDGEEQNLTINTFNALGHLSNKVDWSDNKKNYEYIDSDGEEQIGDKALSKGQWVLMTKNVLEGSRNKDYSTQQKLVSDLSKKSGVSYEVPTLLEVLVCVLAEYVRTNTWLLPSGPWMFTRCQDETTYRGRCYQTIIGGFNWRSTILRRNYFDHDIIGVVARRKFF